MNTLNTKWQRALALLVLIGLGVSWHFFAGQVGLSAYRIFPVRESMSWAEDDDGITRKAALGPVENILLSRDSWQDFELNTVVSHPRDCGFVFRFQDPDNLTFVLFNQAQSRVLWGERKNGQTLTYKAIPWTWQEEQNVLLRVDHNKVALEINGRFAGKFLVDGPSGKLGVMINDADDPLIRFGRLSLTGHLGSGAVVSAASPTVYQGIGRKTFFSFLSFYSLLIVLAWLFSDFLLGRAGSSSATTAEMVINTRRAWAVHGVLTALIFWPFVTRGAVLISSYDNIGEILPLFFLSKHNLAQFLAGRGLPLWNALAHNGVPFFNNHWNMIYYPLNWPVFLMPDRWVLTALTAKALIETFLVGILAFGFFKREFKNSFWALFCSTAYQLCSLLIFCFTVFPTVSLYFSMTWFLYLLWSAPQRSRMWNFLLLSLSGYCLLTSANVAFVFYAVISLAVVTIYKFWSQGSQGRRTFRLVFAAAGTGGLLAAIRLLPCFWGVSASNRLVSHYPTLHNRVSMILRLLWPQISGWYGTGSFNALTAPNLNLIFEQANLPSNSQNTFFVYFGVLTALLVMASVFIKTSDGFRFWKVYALGTIAMSLFLHPVWGVVSILFFPFNHPSYHAIVLPVGICALAGHVGMHLQRGPREEGLGKKTLAAFFLLQAYALVFMTYLFPVLTPVSRLIFLSAITAGAVWGLSEKGKAFLRKLALPAAGIGLILLGAAFSVLCLSGLLRPVPFKAHYFDLLAIPALSLVLVMACGWLLFLCRQRGTRRTFWIGLGLLILSTLTAAGVVSSSFFSDFLKFPDGLGTYLLDLLTGEILVILVVLICASAWLAKKRFALKPSTLQATLLLVLILDLIVFNLRFDQVTAPFFYRHAFYPRHYQYSGLDPKLRKGLDLVNYRISGQHRAGLRANQNLLFDLPSYTGTIGYMPQRFYEFVRAFGYPPETILIYPVDEAQDPRFLDLSAVKYVFANDRQVETRYEALSRLSLFYNYEIVPDEQALSRLRDPEFDIHQSVILSRTPLGFASEKRDERVKAQMVPIGSSRSGRVEARVSTFTPSLAVLLESYDQGWQADLDGEKVPILIADHNFMAVVVPAGTHQLRFIYWPQQFTVSVVLSMAGLVILVGGCFYLGWRKESGRKKGGGDAQENLDH